MKKLLLLFLTINIFSFSNNELNLNLEYKKLNVNSVSDIFEKREGLYVFSKLNIDLRKVKNRKKVFINLMLPAINVVQKRILNDRKNVKILKDKKTLSNEEKAYLKRLFAKYKVKYGNFDELLNSLIIYPTSLILTQGAIESGWGTSRFFRQGNNIFGIHGSKGGSCMYARAARVCVRKFETLVGSVEYLVMMMSTKKVYNQVKVNIQKGKSPYEIAGGLLYYSERKTAYINEVRRFMKANNFTKYDKQIPYLVK